MHYFHKRWLLCLAALLIAVGCVSKSTMVKYGQKLYERGLQEGKAVPVTTPPKSDVPVIGTFFTYDLTSAPTVPPVYFAPGSSDLDAPSLEILRDNASQIKDGLSKIPDLRIAIIGSCDPRGRTDYNVDLAIERAFEVKRIYLEAGIPQDSLFALGAGELLDFCASDPTEQCFASLRRASTYLWSIRGLSIGVQE